MSCHLKDRRRYLRKRKGKRIHGENRETGKSRLSQQQYNHKHSQIQRMVKSVTLSPDKFSGHHLEIDGSVQNYIMLCMSRLQSILCIFVFWTKYCVYILNLLNSTDCAVKLLRNRVLSNGRCVNRGRLNLGFSSADLTKFWAKTEHNFPHMAQ